MIFLQVFSSQGNYLQSIGSYGSGDGQLRVPYGIASDHHDNLYVADHYNDRVSVFTIEGKFLQHLVTPQQGLVRPKSLALRRGHVRLYIAHGGLRTTEVLAYTVEGKVKGEGVSFKMDI